MVHAGKLQSIEDAIAGLGSSAAGQRLRRRNATGFATGARAGSISRSACACIVA